MFRLVAHIVGKVWEVVRGPSRVAGVRMAGFLGAGPVDVRVVPHPAVTLVLEFGNGPLVADVVTGRQQRGNLVAGYLHGARSRHDVASPSR